MRTGGLVSDFLGEIRIEEPRVFDEGFLGQCRLITWKSGRFEMGYPFGMPLGVDRGVAFQVYTAGSFCCTTGETREIASVVRGEVNWFEIIGVATRLGSVEQLNVIERDFGRRARLEWAASGSDDISEYRIFHDSRTGTVDYDSLIATVDARPGGVAPDSYFWTSDELTAGSWKFGIRSVDAAGNEQTTPARETPVTISALPYPPTELACVYDDETHKATLGWSLPESWD